MDGKGFAVRQWIYLSAIVSLTLAGCFASPTPAPTPTPTQSPTTTPTPTLTPEPTPTAAPEVVQELPLVWLDELFSDFISEGLEFEYDTATCVSTEYKVYGDCVVDLDLCPGDVGCVDSLDMRKSTTDNGDYLDIYRIGEEGNDYQLFINEGLVIPEDRESLVFTSFKDTLILECVTRKDYLVEVLGMWNVSEKISEFLYHPNESREVGLWKSAPLPGGYRDWSVCTPDELQ